MSDIAIVTACFGDLDVSQYWDYVYPTVDRYCDRYDLDFHHYNEKLGDEDRTGHWTKIPALLNHLDDYEWLVWFDCDIMIMNHMIDIRDWIDESYDLIVTQFFKDKKYSISSGLMFVRGKCDWSRDFLEYSYYGDNYHTRNPTEKWHEQSSMGCFLKDHHPNDNVLIRDPTIHKMWPTYFPEIENLFLHPEDGSVKEWLKRYIEEDWFFKKGDFLAHVPWRPPEERGEIYEKLSHHVLWHD